MAVLHVASLPLLLMATELVVRLRAVMQLGKINFPNIKGGVIYDRRPGVDIGSLPIAPVTASQLHPFAHQTVHCLPSL